MKKNLQRFGASVLAAAMVAQSVALPAAAETTKIDSSAAQSVSHMLKKCCRERD